MARQKIILLDNKGQTLVEYVLLMAVIATVSVSVINSSAFKKLMGKDAAVFKKYGTYIQYSYRHTHPGTADTSEDDDYQSHRSYVSPKGGSRFFTPLDPYKVDN